MVTVESSFCSCFFLLYPSFVLSLVAFQRHLAVLLCGRGEDAREAEFGSRISSGGSYRKLVISGFLLFFQ